MCINMPLKHQRTMPENNTGLVEDPRTPEEKERDYPHEEVAPQGIQLKWNRGLEDAPEYSIRNQGSSSSCVAQATAKALEVLRKEVISAHPIYARRANIPQLGMYLQNAGEIVRKLGTTTEALDPSQGLSEQDMNKPVTVPTPINDYLYVFPRYQDIDEIATAIETWRHCHITVGCNASEWNEKPEYNGKEKNFYHDVCATWYFTDSEGNKCLRIDESWGNTTTHRVITETFLKLRGTGAMYHIPPVEKPAPEKPLHRFQVPLVYGDRNYSVKMLQDILKYEGCMDIKIVSNGVYGPATASGVDKYQRKYNIAPIEELDALAKQMGGYGRRVGLKTIKDLNSKYGS